MAVPGYDRSVNMLRWSLHGGSARDLIEEMVPERFQDQPTAFERAAAEGVEVTLVGPVQLAHTGLTRAVFCGGCSRNGFSLGDLAAETVAALRVGRRGFVYAFQPGLDGPGVVGG